MIFRFISHICLSLYPHGITINTVPHILYSVQCMYIITHKNRHHSRVGYGMVLNPRHVMVTLSVISRDGGYGAFLLVELLCKGAVNRDFQPPVLSSIEAIPSLAKISPSYSNFSKSPIEIGYSTVCKSPRRIQPWGVTHDPPGGSIDKKKLGGRKSR